MNGEDSTQRKSANADQANSNGPLRRLLKTLTLPRETANTIATFLLVLVGIWGIFETRSAIKTSERAWVYTYSAMYQSPPVDGQPLHYAILFSNSGKQPATDVTYGVAVQQGVIDAPRNLDFSNTNLGKNSTCFSLDAQKNGGIIPPMQTGGGVSRSSDSGRGDNPVFADPDIVSGKKFFYVQGCVAYRTFGEVHHTGFCYIFMRLPSVITSVTVIPPAVTTTPSQAPGSAPQPPPVTTVPTTPAIPAIGSSILSDQPTACNGGNFTD